MSELIAKVALAVKYDMGRQMEAKPLHGNAESGDWTAMGTTVDLEQTARAAIAAVFDHLAQPSHKACVDGDPAKFAPGDSEAIWEVMLSTMRREALGDRP